MKHAGRHDLPIIHFEHCVQRTHKKGIILITLTLQIGYITWFVVYLLPGHRPLDTGN